MASGAAPAERALNHLPVLVSSAGALGIRVISKQHSTPRKEYPMSSTLLWIVAVILVIVGVVQLLQGQILFGAVLIALGCLVGPGGYSIFRGRHA
jgi:hypothetical protein